MLRYATPSDELNHGPAEVSAPIQKAKVLTVLSLERYEISKRVKAFVEVQKGPQWIRQELQTYSWEHFCSLDGARDALEDFLLSVHESCDYRHTGTIITDVCQSMGSARLS